MTRIRHLAAMFSFVLLAAAPKAGVTPYLSAQHLVDVGNGRRLNVYCSGSGSPTVILDAPLGSALTGWHDVQPLLAGHVRVCSYDRAGYGFSDPGGPAHTTNQNVTDLHDLLTNAHIRPPYVLVAHSLNGFDARVFADRYRAEVAGMVLLDPSETDESRFGAIYGKNAESQSADLHFIQHCRVLAHRRALRPGDACVGPANPQQPPTLQKVELEHALSAGMWDAVYSEMASLPDDLREVRSEQRSYGNLPLLVLTAGAAEAQGAPPGTTHAQIAAANRLWKELRDADAAHSSFGINCVVKGAGHYLQLERPKVVADAILQIVQDANSHTKPSCQ